MIDVGTMIKALRLAWIPRHFAPEKKNWKTIPDDYLGRYGGLSFLLRCNYCSKYFDGLSSFYKDILMFFSELKTLYNYHRGQDMNLLNNKEILVGGKPIFIGEWFNNNILFIQDLLNSNGQLMSYQEFKNKFACKSNFLQFYQIVSAMPKHLITKAKDTVPLESQLYVENSPFFHPTRKSTIH